MGGGRHGRGRPDPRGRQWGELFSELLPGSERHHGLLAHKTKIFRGAQNSDGVIDLHRFSQIMMGHGLILETKPVEMPQPMLPSTA